MVEFLQQTALFRDCPAGLLAQITAEMTCRTYAAGDFIFHQGDPGTFLYLLKTGQVRIFVNGLLGQETSVILCARPGEIFGELAVTDGLPRSATAVAIAPTELYLLNREIFRRHMLASPQLALNFMQTLSQKVRYNTHQVDSLASLSISERLAYKLLELAQKFGTVEAEGVRLNTTLNQSDLASLVGATRESVNKVLRRFRRQQLIALESNHIIILDAEALRLVANGQRA